MPGSDSRAGPSAVLMSMRPPGSPAPELSLDPGAELVTSPRAGTWTLSPSTNGAARLSRCAAAAASTRVPKPPAAAMASPTRDPGGRRYRPGRVTAPSTSTIRSAATGGTDRPTASSAPIDRIASMPTTPAPSMTTSDGPELPATMTTPTTATRPNTNSTAARTSDAAGRPSGPGDVGRAVPCPSSVRAAGAGSSIVRHPCVAGSIGPSWINGRVGRDQGTSVDLARGTSGRSADVQDRLRRSAYRRLIDGRTTRQVATEAQATTTAPCSSFGRTSVISRVIVSSSYGDGNPQMKWR